MDGFLIASVILSRSSTSVITSLSSRITEAGPSWYLEIKRFNEERLRFFAIGIKTISAPCSSFSSDKNLEKIICFDFNSIFSGS